MLWKTKLLTSVLCLSVFGCSSVPVKEYAPQAPVNETKALEALSTAWNSVGVEREGRPSMVLLTPFSVPESVRAKRVRIELEAGATVTDLVAVLANLGYSIILADPSVGQKSFYLPRYNGPLGGLLSAVSRAADVWFTYHDGVIHVTSDEKVTLTLPQEEGLAEKVTKGLTDLGIEGSTVSWEAGMVTVRLTPSQLEKVKLFLQRMSANASLVTLQVAVLNVVLNQNASTGVDWGGLQLAIGSGHRAAIEGGLGLRPQSTGRGWTPPPTGGNRPPVDTGDGTTGNTTTPSTSTATTVSGLVGGALWSGNALRGVISNNVFSFVGLVNFLENYGSTETKQNVVLKTVAGNEVKLESVTEIPYVSNVGVTTTGNNSSSVLGSASTSKAKDGLTLTLTPTYDAAAESVTVKMDLSIDAVLGFTDLSAGSQLGQMSQPTTARRSFNDVLRLRPGQTVVVGGITYDSVGSTSGVPVFLSKDWENRTLTVTRQAMFIVVRPSVTVLGQMTKEQGSELFESATEATGEYSSADAKSEERQKDEKKTRRPADNSDKDDKPADVVGAKEPDAGEGVSAAADSEAASSAKPTRATSEAEKSADAAAPAAPVVELKSAEKTEAANKTSEQLSEAQREAKASKAASSTPDVSAPVAGSAAAQFLSPSQATAARSPTATGSSTAHRSGYQALDLSEKE
jgi:type II secretory pathway component GspD/PulD (secretin)